MIVKTENYRIDCSDSAELVESIHLRETDPDGVDHWSVPAIDPSDTEQVSAALYEVSIELHLMRDLVACDIALWLAQRFDRPANHDRPDDRPASQRNRRAWIEILRSIIQTEVTDEVVQRLEEHAEQIDNELFQKAAAL